MSRPTSPAPAPTSVIVLAPEAVRASGSPEANPLALTVDAPLASSPVRPGMVTVASSVRSRYAQSGSRPMRSVSPSSSTLRCSSTRLSSTVTETAYSAPCVTVTVKPLSAVTLVKPVKS